MWKKLLLCGVLIAVVLACLLVFGVAMTGPEERAQSSRMYERIFGP
jgi:hypothetical protein